MSSKARRDRALRKLSRRVATSAKLDKSGFKWLSSMATDSAYRYEDSYFESLPNKQLSVCPFCNQVLTLKIDPFGYDGPWWWKRRSVAREEQCPHYCVIRSATKIGQERLPLPRDATVELGPEVPYVIPRLLHLPAMKCVVSKLDLECGYDFFTMVYYSEKPTAHQELTANWADTFFNEYERRRENWDFELTPWIVSGVIHWTSHGQDGMKLEPQVPANFPFDTVDGFRGQQSLWGSEYRQYPAPTEGASKYDGSND